METHNDSRLEKIQKSILSKIGFDNYSEYAGKERHSSHVDYGLWQIEYGKMFDYAFDISGRNVLDIGCASGAISQSFFDRGATPYGCDINSKGLEITPFNKIKKNLYCVDFIETDLFNNINFHLIHSQQVFEHFPSKEYSEKVVEKIASISSNSFVYVGLVTGNHLTVEQLIEMQHSGIDVDVTHINIWPYDFWINLFKMYGLKDVTEYIAPIINCYIVKENGFSYYSEYHWHQFIFCGQSLHIEDYALDRLDRLLYSQKNYQNINIYKEVALRNDTNGKMTSLIKKYL